MMRTSPWLVAVALAGAFSAQARAADAALLRADDARVVHMGRTAATPEGALRFGYAGVTLRVAFEGTWLSMDASSSSGNSLVDVSVDGGAPVTLKLGREPGRLLLVRNAAPGRHTVELVHRTETWIGVPEIRDFVSDGSFTQAPPPPARKLLVMGDSVTCGTAMERPATGDKNDPSWWNARMSYGMLAARALDAQVQLVCFGGRGLVRSWNGRTDEYQLPAFYELAIADAAHPVKWQQADYDPDLILVAIGTNDFSQGIPEHGPYVATYAGFVRTLLRNHPRAQIVLTEGAILDGEKKAALTRYLNETVDKSASARVHYVQSLHHPGDQSDAHPTTPQHAAMAQELVPPLRRLMNW